MTAKASDSNDGKKKFTCPICKEPVIYDPNDPKYITTGAALRKAGQLPDIVYLECILGHTSRYSLKDAIP